jgi:hypothetical protein
MSYVSVIDPSDDTEELLAIQNRGRWFLLMSLLLFSHTNVQIPNFWLPRKMATGSMFNSLRFQIIRTRVCYATAVEISIAA